MEYIINETHANMRLDKAASLLSNQTRNKIQELIDERKINVNTKPAKANYRVKLNDILWIPAYNPKRHFIEAAEIDLEIVYEDAYLLVVNKQRGISVHPSHRNLNEVTLLHGLIAHLNKNSNSYIRPGIVHRLDKQTEGLLIVAKDERTHQRLAHDIEMKLIKRRYLAATRCLPPQQEGIIELSIERSKCDKRLMEINPQGKKAITRYRVINVVNGITYIECELFTGRTHQIRIHLSVLGCPIIGDPLYGKNTKGKGQALLAYDLEFIHPMTHESMHFTLDSQKLVSYAESISGDEL